MKKIILIASVFALLASGTKAQNCQNDGFGNSTDGFGNSMVCDALKPMVYPNPVNDELNFVFQDSIDGIVYIKIYDMVGRIIDSKKFPEVPNLVTFEVGNLPSGIYLYEIKNNATIIRDRFLKE